MQNHSFRILVVDDEADICDILSYNLRKAGYEVDVAHSAEEALKTDLSVYDLFLLDVMMGEMSGFTMATRLKENPATTRIPVIFLTAKDSEDDTLEGLSLGADDYITKPFSPSELVARVKAHMARYERLVGAGQKTNDIIEIRGLKIDKTARRVWVNGEEKNFTTKEFDLLTFLAENPNHVFSKEELFAKIWNMESVGDIATVTVHIKKIREKIEFNTSKPQYIETIWGVGYRFKI